MERQHWSTPHGAAKQWAAENGWLVEGDEWRIRHASGRVSKCPVLIGTWQDLITGLIRSSLIYQDAGGWVARERGEVGRLGL